MSYTATIRHHSIARARSITVDGSLTAAKAAATREFGGGYLDHEIVVIDDSTDLVVARRRIRDTRWHTSPFA